MNSQSSLLLARLPYHLIRMPKGFTAFRLSIAGGLGGDAEADIARQRANAIKIVANLLQVSITHKHIAIYLINLEGGQAPDSIPQSAVAMVVLPEESAQDFRDLIIQGSCAVQAQYGVSDPNVEVLLEEAVWNGNVIDEESTRCLLADINAIPVGVLEWHPEMQGTPMTSNNIGLVRRKPQGAEGGVFEISTLLRSFRPSDLELLSSRLQQIFEVSGAEVEEV